MYCQFVKQNVLPCLQLANCVINVVNRKPLRNKNKRAQQSAWVYTNSIYKLRYIILFGWLGCFLNREICPMFLAYSKKFFCQGFCSLQLVSAKRAGNEQAHKSWNLDFSNKFAWTIKIRTDLYTNSSIWTHSSKNWS